MTILATHDRSMFTRAALQHETLRSRGLCVLCGAGISEIGTHFPLHYSTVSRITTTEAARKG
jgi:hypothetical protein